MKCPYCNQEIEDNSVFCSECGKNLNDTGKGKKKLWIIPAVAAAAAAAGAGVFLLWPSDPKDAVVDAFKSITAEGQTNPWEDIFGVAALKERMVSGANELELEIAYEDSSFSEFEILESGSVKMVVDTDRPENEYGFVLGIDYAGMNLANMELYVDQKEMIAAIPEIFDYAFSVNYSDNIQQKLEDSPFIGRELINMGLNGEDVEKIRDEVFAIVERDNKLFNLKELWNRYKSECEAFDQLKAETVVEKADKKEFEINGKNVKCRGYHVDIPVRSLVEFLEETKDYILDDEILKEDVVTCIELIKEADVYGYAIPSTSKETQKELWKEADKVIDDFIKVMDDSMEDISMNVYVARDGKMAGFELETEIKVDSERIEVNGKANFAGGYNMLANVDAELELSGEGDSVTIELEKAGTYQEKELFEESVALNMNVADEHIGKTYEFAYQMEDDVYELSAEVSDDGNVAAKMSSEGSINNVVKGTSFEVEIDEMSISVPDEEANIELSGSYAMRPLENGVKKPSGEKLDVLEMTEMEMFEIVMEAMGKIESLGSKLGL